MQKAKGKCKETGTGSERNGSERKMKRALERNQMQENARAERQGPRDGNEKKLMEIMGNEEKLKRNEGMCRKLTRKWEARLKSRELKRTKGKECE